MGLIWQIRKEQRRILGRQPGVPAASGGLGGWGWWSQGWRVLKSPQATPLCPTPGKTSSNFGSQLQEDPVPGSRRVALVSLATSIRGNILFVQPDFFPGRRLFYSQITANGIASKYQVSIHDCCSFHFYCLVGNKEPETQQERLECLSSLLAGGGQTYIHCCRH